MARAILFDFNGTLSADEHIMYEVVAEVYAGAGRPISHAEYLDQLAGIPDEVAVPRQAIAEHSPRPAASSSVRALSAPISSGASPLPAAMPAISSPSSGENSPMRSSASAPNSSTWPSSRPFSRNRRR